MARIIITLTAPLFYFFVFSLFSHQTMSQRQHLQTFCNPSDNFTQTSSYETNRDTLLASLCDSSSLGTYSNATIGLSPDTVYGMFLCRGDTHGTTISCADCVQTATIEIATNCSLNKAAIIYYQKCMVRYSNFPFFTLMETYPRIGLTHNKPAPNLNRFNQTLFDKFDQLILNVSSSSPIPYFVEDQELVTQPEGSYELESMVQCSPDLDQSNCTVCLRFALFRISICCGSPSIAQVFTPKCILWYKTTVSPSPPLSPSPLSLPPQPSWPPSLSQPPQPNIPSSSFPMNVIKGNEIFGRILVTMTALLVLALMDM